jgi:hypothetical protein
MRRKIVKSVFLSIPVLVVAAILGVVAMAVSVGTVLATPGSGFTRTVQGSATLEPFRVHTDDFEIHMSPFPMQALKGEENSNNLMTCYRLIIRLI